MKAKTGLPECVRSNDGLGHTFGRHILVKDLTHADTWFNRVAYRLVERGRGFVCGQKLKIDLHAANRNQGLFGVPDQAGTKARAAEAWMYRYGIEPAAVTVVAGHCSTDQQVSVFCNEEQAVVRNDLLGNGKGRFIVRGFVTEDSTPQRDDLFPIGGIVVLAEIWHGRSRVA